ncbi:DUF6571 family protein [Demequina sp. TTPB684]|uniref:DUF6571 family protein n=1 Tax=unclassified Demequina TaxID=2620311 RepID=UPI00351CDD51
MSSYPEVGHTGQVREFADTQRLRSQSLHTLADDVGRLQGSSSFAGWNSQVADSYRARLTRLGALLGDVAAVTDRWDRSARSYADSLDAMGRTAEGARQDVSSGTAMRAGLMHVSPESLPPGYWAQRVSEADDLIAQGHGALYALQQQRSVIDTAFASSLAYVGGVAQSVDWAGMVSLYAGAQSVADIRERRAELLAEANRLADAVEGFSSDADDIAALTALLQSMGADPGLAGAFWSGRGGDTVLDLMEAGLRQYGGDGFTTAFHSDEDREAALAFARAIRESLASGSATWGEAAARNFASQMLTGDDWPGGNGFRTNHLAGVGFLFDDADNHPMGPGFTTAMADLFDMRERGEGVPGEARGSSQLEAGATYGLFDGIAIVDQLERGEAYGSNVGSGTGTPVRDPMGRVLDTLGHYPDAAWEWLSADGGTLANGAPAIAGDKVAYWSSRDWSADGWDGFGSMWEGSMRADGGFMDGPPNSSTWDAQCDVAVRVVDGLERGLEPVRPGDLSVGGALALGTGLAEIMPLIEPTIWSSGTIEGNLDHGRSVAGMPGDVTVPNFNDDALGEVMGHVGSTVDGFAALRSGVSHTQDLLLHDADAGGTYQTWDSGLKRVTDLEGAFEGALGGADILQGRFDDNVVRQKLAAMDLLWSVAPLPDLGAVGNLAVGQGSSAVAGSFESAVVNNERLAVEFTDVSSIAGSGVIAAQISRLDNDPSLSLQGVVLEGDVNGTDRTEWLNSFADEYRAYFGEGARDGSH